jgi:hypothetical protein
MRCPQCQALLEEGVVPISGGIHWLRRKDGDIYDFAEDVPGTHAIMRPNRLPAWRCKKCQLILFRFGHEAQAQQQRETFSESSGETT